MSLLLVFAAAATTTAQPAVRTATFVVRARVEVTCVLSPREMACRGAEKAAPLARRLEANGTRLTIEL